MAMQLHPDKNTSEDGEKFQHLSCADAIIIQYIQQLQSGEYGCGSNDQQQDCKESLNMECDDEYLSEVRVQPKHQCLVLEMGALTHKFYGVCAEMYGTPRDQGTNGFKFTHPMYAKNVERDRADEGAEDWKEGCHSKSYGIVHITVSHSTGRVLVQGVPYLFCAENAGGALADTKGVCTRDGCSEDCDQLVQCDACDGWVHCHTACSGLSKAVMEYIAAKREEMFICVECTKMGDVNGDTMDSTASLAQLKAIEPDTKQSTSEVIEVIWNLEVNIISVVQKAYDHKNDLQLSVLIKQREDEKAEQAKLEGIIAENNKQINRFKSENKKANTKSASTQTQHTKKTIPKPAGTQTQQVWPQIEGREGDPKWVWTGGRKWA